MFDRIGHETKRIFQRGGGDDLADVSHRRDRRFFPAIFLGVSLLVLALAVAACSPFGSPTPSPIGATPTGAASPVPSGGTALATPTVGAAGTATPDQQPASTATVQAQGTIVARAVEGTVTVKVQALATAATLSAQQTAAAGAPSPATTGAATPAVLTPTPATASPVPTRSVASACRVQPVRGFSLVYTANATVASGLGCAVDTEVGTSSAMQSFDGGLMLAFGNAKQVLVLRTSGATWSAVADNYQTGQPLPTPTIVAPAGRFAPVGSFGLVWQQQPNVHTQLGWATAPAQTFTTGAVQEFAHGRMVWTPNKIIYVLYADNTWQSFPDTFQG
ncbi:MAG TPA: hypothetical protein VNL16_19035 [Chloroflexota bacterium]|nr:hypothetical protein [Chloroflexota bacterium]